MDFEQAYEQFLKSHIDRRSGERKGRLLRGHRHAERLLLEKLWWPICGHFDHLHPEYEVFDWNRRSMFLDTAFTPKELKLNIELDGYQTHVKDMDREKHSRALQRDNFLIAMGWKILRFSYDDVVQRPELCRMMIQMTLSNSMVGNPNKKPISLLERELLQQAWLMGQSIRPTDLIAHYNINFRTARNRLHALVEKGLLKPVVTGRGIRNYMLTDASLKHLL